MKILDNNYYYLTDRFKSKSGDTWRLSGTRTGETHYAKNAIDTFINLRTREFQDIERIKVYEFQQSGRIHGTTRDCSTFGLYRFSNEFRNM